MSRSRARQRPASLSLFPFLAVLICTMGALVALLVLLIAAAQKTALSASEASVARTSEMDETREALLRQAEALDQQRENALRDRETLLANLTDQRRTLGVADEHLRKLKDQARTLARRLARFEEDGLLADADVLPDVTKLTLDVTRQADELARKTAELAKLEENVKNKPRAFCILPYDGSGKTTRRPVYLECRDDQVILQPEGIALTPGDLAPPHLPGNPLDAALRAAQEYLDTRGRALSLGTAYPLLIVRPDGAASYAYARASMQSWENEFGYELIGADTPLTFPPSDPGLARAMRQAVADARRRQEALAQAQPTRFGPRLAVADGRGGGGTPGSGGSFSDQMQAAPRRGSGPLRALPRGGFAPVDAPSTQYDPSRFNSGFGSQSGGGAGYAGGSGAPGGRAATANLTTPGGAGSSESTRLASAASASDGPMSARPTLPGEPFGGSFGSSSPGGQGSGATAGGGTGFGPGGPGAGGTEPSSNPSASQPGFYNESQVAGLTDRLGSTTPGSVNSVGGPTGSASPGSATSSAAGNSSPSGGSASSQGTGGTGGASANAPTGSAAAGGSSQGSTTASGGSASGSSSSSGSSGTAGGPSMSGEASNGGASVAMAVPTDPIARTRGGGWAVPQSQSRATAIARPIGVELYPDRIVLVPEKGTDGVPREFPFQSDMGQAVGHFGEQIRQRVEKWGLAGRDFNWQPILTVRVQPGGETQLPAIRRLLDGSGLVVEEERR